MPNPLRVECTRLADQLERSLQGGAWHGPSILELLAGLEPDAATWRPCPEAHSIKATVFHLGHWMRDAARRLQGLPGAESGSDWDAPERWPAALEGLVAAHGALQAALRDLDDSRLGGQDPTNRDLLLGLLQHNAYHAGQLACLRKAAAHAAGGGA